MRLPFSSSRMSYSLIAATGFLFHLLASAGAAPAQRLPRDAQGINKVLARMMIPGTQDVQLIIELSEPGVVERMQGREAPGQSRIAKPLSPRSGPIDFASPEATGYRQQVRQTQQSLRNRILALPGAQIQGTTEVVMNALIARVHASDYARLRSLPGVKKVYFSRRRRMLLDQAAIIQNAAGLWASAGGNSQAGRGIKIGLIDTGIDITNPMFNDPSLAVPAGFPKFDTQADRALTNTKVIVARNYVLAQYGYNPQRVQSATDEIGHGTFVAGCAAGKQVAAPLATISGMAPGAFLGNYKVFGTPGVNDFSLDAAVIPAIEDAVSDGMNVINLSLGSLDYIPPSEDPETVVIENAVQAGVVITIAAGNDGPSTHSISTPAAAPDAIAVGSVSNSRQFLAALHTTAPAPIPANLSTIGYLPSADGPAVTTNIAPTGIVDVDNLDGTGLACSTLPSGSLNRGIALVLRGTCTFAAKVSNAVAAGAQAVIVLNNDATAIISMSGLSFTTIPAIMITNDDGAALKQFVDAHPVSVQVAIDNSQALTAIPVSARVISSFSAVGPGMDFGIKPDLVAVGENIYSAAIKASSAGVLSDPSGFTVSTGTSFSAPMVAGAAAVLREAFPSLGPLAIKSLLTSTASRNLTADGIHPPNILESGNGLLDMGSAAAAGAVFSPTSLNFGVHSYSGTLSLAATLTIQNISSSADRFTLAVEPVVSGPTITLSQNITGSMAPGATASIAISLKVDAPSSSGFQGFITAQSSSSSFVYRIPYWAGLYVPDSARVLSISQNPAESGSYHSLSEALAAANPGNIIEIKDSATYSTGANGLVISTNSQGLPLHGVTIRAAAGQTPVIDGTGLASSGSPANIRIVGLKNVLVQGLIINGGYTGIDLLQPDPTVPLSVTIDNCIVSNSSGDMFAAGVFIDGGGTVNITHSIINGSSGTGIVAGLFSDGTQLTLLGTTIETNGNDGLDALGANVDILNSTFSGNQGAGLYLDFCTGTVDGNRITGSSSFTFVDQNGQIQTSYGDGLQIADGNVAVENNLIESNAEAGIALLAGAGTALGPTVQISRNTMRKNGFYGIYSEISPSVLAERNLIEDGGGGIDLTGGSHALLANNIIVRSTDAQLGDGIAVTGASNVRIVNSTIYQNALHGVNLTSGTVMIVNSVVDANGGGDLNGVASNSVQSSLVSINPNFTNPGADDFSPAPGSPAIDAGSNTAPDLPFLDYYGRLRLASAASPPGQGAVDLGAVETSSAYPLVFPLLANGNEPALGGTFTTGFAVMNPTNSAAQVNFAARNGDGSALSGTSNPYLMSLGPKAQFPILGYQLFGFGSGSPSIGSVLTTSQVPLSGFFLMLDPAFSRFSSGVNASAQTGRDLVFMRHEFDAAGQASYVITNPGVNAANISATLFDATGSKIGLPQTATIAPKGQTIFSFNTITTSSGYVRLQSDRPVAGLEIVGNSNSVSVLGAFSPRAESQLYFPHYAVGGNFSTQIGIVNSGESAADLTVNAYGDNGNLIKSITLTLPAGGQFMQAVTDLFGISVAGPVQTGYIVAQGNHPGIMGFTNFTFNDGMHNSTAVVPADSVPRSHLLFSHIAHGINAGSGVPYQTGIALLNPLGTPLGYTISVYDSAGALVAQESDTLGAHQKTARMLSHPVAGAGFFTQPITLGSGHVEVSTDYALLGFELFFTEDYSQLASVPSQAGN